MNARKWMMLLMVALALGISFFQGEKEEEDTAAVVMQEKPVLQATAVPHPIHQYRSRRRSHAQSKQRRAGCRHERAPSSYRCPRARRDNVPLPHSRDPR